MARFKSAAIAAAAIAATLVLLPAVGAYAYDGNGAANYADYWWNGRNPNYKTDFPEDCTDFVSQAMHDPSGGRWAYVNNGSGNVYDDYQWWMAWNGLYFTWSHSWSVAADLKTFLHDHYPGGWAEGSVYGAGYGPEYTPNSVVTGDVIFYDWTSNGSIDHAAMQVGYGTDPNSGVYGNYVDSHTTNRYHAFWTLRPYNSEWMTTTAYYVHIDSRN